MPKSSSSWTERNVSHTTTFRLSSLLFLLDIFIILCSLDRHETRFYHYSLGSLPAHVAYKSFLISCLSSLMLLLLSLSWSHEFFLLLLTSSIEDHFFKWSECCLPLFLRLNHDHLSSPPLFKFKTRLGHFFLPFLQHLIWFHRPFSLGVDTRRRRLLMQPLMPKLQNVTLFEKLMSWWSWRHELMWMLCVHQSSLHLEWLFWLQFVGNY